MLIRLHRWPLSMTGHPLPGDKRVRLIFSDESGNSSREPVVVVASIVVNADLEWRSLSKDLDSVIEKFVPLDYRDGFVFHANEIFKEKFLNGHLSVKRKIDFIKEVVNIPVKRNIPISVGYSFKEKKPGKESTFIAHSGAFCQSIGICDEFISVRYSDECASLVAESIPEMERFFKALHEKMKNGTLKWQVGHFHGQDVAPMHAILGGVLFAKKSEEPLLQIADGCAWVIRRYLSGYDDAEKYIPFIIPELKEIRSREERSAGGFLMQTLPILDILRYFTTNYVSDVKLHPWCAEPGQVSHL